MTIALSTKLTVLIDADVVKYKTAFACQNNLFKVVREDDEEVVATFDKKKDAVEYIEFLALSGKTFTIEKEVVPLGHDDVDRVINRIIKRIKKETKATDMILYLTGHNNFRDEVATFQPYKGHRKNLEKPVHMDYVQEQLIEKYDAIVSENEEADDLLAIEHSKPGLTIISTIDKDLKTVPGLNHNLNTGEVIYVTQLDADKFFAEQLLTGDKADFIPGISTYSNKKKLMGPKTAQKLIAECSCTTSLHQAVADTYQEFAGEDWQKKLLETGTLLFMQRELNQQFDIEEWSKGNYNKIKEDQ